MLSLVTSVIGGVQHSVVHLLLSMVSSHAFDELSATTVLSVLNRGLGAEDGGNCVGSKERRRLQMLIPECHWCQQVHQAQICYHLMECRASKCAIE